MTPTAQSCPTCSRPIPEGATTCPSCSRSGSSGPGDATVIAGTAATMAGEVAQGMRFGQYEVLREVARGAMGIVYQAKDSKLDRVVALKVLIAGELASPDQVARFQREAQAAAKLRHANIVPIYDIGVAAGRHFFTMELVEGKSLHEFLAGKEASIDAAVLLLAQVADGMEHAHRNGVIHRDLKPANILVDAEGNVRVTDFGLSKAVHGSQLTESGTTLGSPSYMPPEQARGQIAEADARSDVYAMGAILYEALTGVPPFVGASQVDTILKVIRDDPLPPRRHNAKVPSELEAICLKAIEKDKSRRYASAKEFGDDLRRYLAREPVLARPASLVYRWKKRLSRHRVAVAIVAAVVLANAVLVVSLSRRQKGAPLFGGEDRWEERADESFREEGLPQWDVEGSWKVERLALVGDGEATLRWKDGLSGSAAIEVDFDEAPTGTLTLRLGDGRQPYPSARLVPTGGAMKVELSDASAVKEDSVEVQAPAGKRHVLRLERAMHSLAAFWDGAPSPVAHADLGPAPSDTLRPELVLSGGHARLVGLCVYGESVAFRGSPLPVAEKLFTRRMYGLAKESYEDCLASHPAGPLAEEARYGAAECALRAAEGSGDPDEAQAARDLFAAVKDARWAPLAKDQIEACDRLLRSGSEAGGIGTLPGLTPSDPFNRLLALLVLKESEAMTPAHEAELKAAYEAAVSSKALGRPAYDACMAWAADRVVKREWSEAEAAYTKAVDLAAQEGKVVAWFLVELCRFQRKDFAGVEGAEKELTKSTPKKVLERLHQLRRSKSDPHAQEEARRLRELLQHPKDPSSSLEDEPLLEEAKAVFDLARLGPYLQYGRLLAIKAMAYQGKTKEALSALQNHLAKENLDPGYEGRLRLLQGHIERIAGDARGATRTFEELQRKGADWLQFEATMQLVETSILTDGGKSALAAEKSARARYKGPSEQGRMALWFGLAHALAGDVPKARAEWGEGLSVQGADASSHAALALALGETPADEEKLKSQLSTAEMKLWRGVASRAAGNKEQAAKQFDGALQDAVGQERPYEVAKFLAGRP